MKRNEVLKAVVILQAVCMIALTGMVMVKVWPLPGLRGNEQGEQTSPPAPTGTEGSGQKPVASVGGQPITGAELTSELYKQYGDEVLRVMMLRRALELESKATGLRISQEELDREIAAAAEGYGDEESFYSMMKEQLGLSKEQIQEEYRYRLLLEHITIKDITVADHEVDRYMQDHPEQFEPQLQFHLRWIVTNTREQAESVLAKLMDGESFAAMARLYSNDQFTAEDGGDLGMIDADDPFYDDEVLVAAAGMAVAEIAGPIELTEQGYAIIELAGRKSTSNLASDRLFEQARRQLALERAKPLNVVEDELLKRYDAMVMK
ncbi:peptidylprolyl isomerase [Paenibacillus sp. NPDC057967]|uniref:peptidylprolyl isomerase n=1 Tax=Paenibacillus sp. NPDC057967 TaxID=3346293 RepID=UPI0036D7D6A8